jgi:acid phosphatase (class A)
VPSLRVLTTIFALFILNNSLLADDFLAENWDKVLGQPPTIGSVEEQDDYLALIQIQDTRTEANCAEAAAEEKITLRNLYGGEKGPLSDEEVYSNTFLFYKYFAMAGLKTKSAKDHFSRKRPFIRFLDLVPCIKKPNPNTSYPSGHTSIARVLAYALSKKYPERKLQFFKRANEISKNRMIGGVHFPSDVVAGKKLADYLAKIYFGLN